jgi:soluble lytic murein transglycosylase
VVRFTFKFLLVLLLAVGSSFMFLAVRSGDPAYTVYEWISPARFQQYDRLIKTVAAEHHLDPMLVKAVVWRESRFDPQKFGSAGERGLMQVTENAANEWARENKVENFRVEELFDPKTNLEAGTWYLQRAAQHWEQQPDPIPFALAEYNAGASRVQRWVGGGPATNVTPRDFMASIDFPGTKNYVDSVIARHHFYKRRGRM